MKRKTTLVTVMILLMSLCACGKATIQINDNGIDTEVEVSVPRTVEKILTDADIVLNDGDEVDPALDTKISEAQKIVISRKHTVQLTADGETKEVTMVGGTIKDLLEQEGITLGEKQHINYDLDEYLADGMDIKLFYLFNITVQCDGENYSKETEKETVGDVLAELEITLGENDRVTPAITETVKDGMEIVVNRVIFDTLVETEEIGYETLYEDDSSLPKGQEQVGQKGENGEKEVTYQITYVDGTEESREVTTETVTKEPVNKVILVGTKEEAPPVYEEAPSESSGRSIVSQKAFYDCDGSGHGYYEITYSDGSVEYVDF